MTQEAKVTKGFLMVLVLLVFSLTVGALICGRGGHNQNRLPNYDYIPQITAGDTVSISTEGTPGMIYCSNGFPLSFGATINTDGLIDWLPPETHPQHHTANGNVNDSNTTEGRTEK